MSKGWLRPLEGRGKGAGPGHNRTVDSSKASEVRHICLSCSLTTSVPGTLALPGNSSASSGGLSVREGCKPLSVKVSIHTWPVTSQDTQSKGYGGLLRSHALLP